MVDVNSIVSSAGSALESAKSWFSIDKLTGLATDLIDKIPDEIMAIYNAHKSICMFAAICLLALIAFEGYKILRMAVFGGGAFLFGIIGFMYLAPNLPESVVDMVPDIVDINALCAVACALAAVLFASFAYNFMIMILGGVAGYFLGSMFLYGLLLEYFNTLDFLYDPKAEMIVGFVVAAVVGLLFVLVFKPLFTVLTTFGALTGAAVLLQMLLVPEADESLRLSFIVLGLAAAIFAMARQRKDETLALSIL